MKMAKTRKMSRRSMNKCLTQTILGHMRRNQFNIFCVKMKIPLPFTFYLWILRSVFVRIHYRYRSHVNLEHQLQRLLCCCKPKHTSSEYKY